MTTVAPALQSLRSRIRLPEFSLYAFSLVLLLAAGWLLPNHYKPWNTFHSNAWVAGVLLLAAWRQIAVGREPLVLTPGTAVLLGVSLIPWLHHALGLLSLFSDALVNGLYLLGVSAAYATGQRWARRDPCGPFDFVLGAAAIASGVQVIIMVYQWLGYAAEPDLMDIWILPFVGDRVYGNLGQPNQLASLILLGMLGCYWAWHRQLVRGWGAALLAAAFCLGAALTASRTALLSLSLSFILISLPAGRRLQPVCRRSLQLLYLFYVLAFVGLSNYSESLRSGNLNRLLDRESPVTRPALARMAIDASREHPWLGWGWNQTNEAFLHVYPHHPSLADIYVEQSHNLPLDLVLWTGWPLGLLLTGVALYWAWRSVRSATTVARRVGLAAMGVLVVHALLELPLHYGYFLWPFALLAGAVAEPWDSRQLLAVPRWGAAAVLAVMTGLAAIIMTDYLRVEETFRELRFQLQRIGSGHDERPPEVLLMNDWRNFIIMMREQPKPGMTNEQIDNWRALLIYNTAPLPLRKLIGALELNGRHEEAVYWADRACALLAPPKCKHMLDEWTSSRSSPPPVLDDTAVERPRTASGLMP